MVLKRAIDGNFNAPSCAQGVGLDTNGVHVVGGGPVIDDVRVVAATITALSAVGVFFAGRFVGYIGETVRRRRAQTALVSAIFTEIKCNVEELEESRARLPNEHVVRRHFTDKESAKVLIVYSRNMVFFDDLRAEMGALNTDLLEDVVRFYAVLQKIYGACEAVSGETFAGLTVEGKVGVLSNLEGHTNDAIKAGRSALDSFRRHYGRAVLGHEAFKSPRDQDQAFDEFLRTVNGSRTNIIGGPADDNWIPPPKRPHAP
jgi:hypothetical protein